MNQYTLPSLNATKLFETEITKNAWAAANWHARIFGGGGIPDPKFYSTGNKLKPRYDIAGLQHAFKWAAGDDNLQQVATGTAVVKTDDGEPVLLPAMTRKYSLEQSFDLYKAYVQQEGGSLEVSKDTFFMVMGILGPHSETLLDALDSVYVKCGLRNFQNMRSVLVPAICVDRPLVGKALLDMIDEVHNHTITLLWFTSHNIPYMRRWSNSCDSRFKNISRRIVIVLCIPSSILWEKDQLIRWYYGSIVKSAICGCCSSKV